jgi:hypothetical protein
MITPPHAINHDPVQLGGSPILIIQPNFHCCLHYYIYKRYNTTLRTRCTNGWNLCSGLGSYAVQIPSTLLKLVTFVHSHFFMFCRIKSTLTHGSFIQRIRPGPRLLVVFRNKLIFYGEELLAPRPLRVHTDFKNQSCRFHWYLRKCNNILKIPLAVFMGCGLFNEDLRSGLRVGLSQPHQPPTPWAGGRFP